ncbi:fimbrial biogenesis chaperone [Pandoraea aquatica]|nr:molecular chaperone [Pandoraea aquatica]
MWRRIACVIVLCASIPTQAATSVMIWPIDPVIESDQRATALWLENRDVHPVTLQIRVLAWRQSGWEDLYAENQQRVVGSPPVANVSPGQRQLIRLTKLDDVAPGTETAYRVLVDEIPQPRDPAVPESGSTVGVRFQMHYSIPLFVNGAGVRTKDTAEHPREHDRLAVPALVWQVALSEGKRWLVLSNRGAVHARITSLAVTSGATTTSVGEGLLGYVLPGAQMRWPLPEGMQASPASRLVATVNGVAGVLISSAQSLQP